MRANMCAQMCGFAEMCGMCGHRNGRNDHHVISNRKARVRELGPPLKTVGALTGCQLVEIQVLRIKQIEYEASAT